MSDGTTRTVSGTWGTDAPTVATAEATTGRVTAVGSGSVTVFVDYQGHRGTRLIRGLPNFQGAWSGSYAVRSCTQSGQIAAAKLCDAFQPNRVFPTNLSLTQDADRVQGRFFLGTLGGEGSVPSRVMDACCSAAQSLMARSPSIHRGTWSRRRLAAWAEGSRFCGAFRASVAMCESLLTFAISIGAAMYRRPHWRGRRMEASGERSRLLPGGEEWR
jgi:hypothetical protein